MQPLSSLKEAAGPAVAPRSQRGEPALQEPRGRDPPPPPPPGGGGGGRPGGGCGGRPPARSPGAGHTPPPPRLLEFWSVLTAFRSWPPTRLGRATGPWTVWGP